MIPAKQAAKLFGITVQHMRRLCAAGKIPGATKVGRDWVLPDQPKIKGKK